MGYVKRMTPDNFKSQHRGGKGIKGMQTLEEDYIEDLFMTTSHHVLTFFTNTEELTSLRHMRYQKQEEHQEEQLLLIFYSLQQEKL